MRRRSQSESGFALLLIFVLAAGIAISMLMQLPRVAFETARNREEILIQRGEQYKRAIGLYFRKTNRLPAKIEDLENTNNIRFLRRRYIDPMTGKDEWRIVHAGAGGVLIDSLVQKAPAPASGMGTGTGQQQSSQNFGANPGNTVGSSAATGEEPAVNAAVLRRPSDRVPAGMPGGVSGGQVYDPGAGPPPPPGGPVYPGQPGYPQPGTPGHTGQAIYPGQPGYPQQNQQSANQSQPIYPGQPGYPQPGTPGYTGQPIYPGQPGYPQQNQQSVNQSQPIYPGQPGYPQPGTPGYTGQPIYPGQPGYPQQQQQQLQAQAQPIYPGQPGYPQPGTPGYTGQPIYPGQPGYPAQIQPNPNPTLPIYPGQAGYPQPGTPGYTGQPIFPGQPGYPQNPMQNLPGVVNAQGGAPMMQPGLPQQPGYNTAQIPGQTGGTGNAALGMIGDILRNPRTPPAGVAFNNTGVQGGIAGVASNFKGPSIKIYKERQKYQEWEFVYDIKDDPYLRQRGVPGGQQMPGGQQGGPGGQSGRERPMGGSGTSGGPGGFSGPGFSPRPDAGGRNR